MVLHRPVELAGFVDIYPDRSHSSHSINCRRFHRFMNAGLDKDCTKEQHLTAFGGPTHRTPVALG